ncbi:MAG: tetratricopeptide repeat protein [Acidobacteriota bacterium]
MVTFAPMKLCLALLALLIVAQDGHTLFGDFKVAGETDPNAPITFNLILYTRTGNVVGRQTITNNGRYKFFGVSNGEYFLTVELANEEVARIPIMIQEFRKTDIRQDIELEWRGSSKKPPATGTVAADMVYDRTTENKIRFEKALEAIRRKDYKQAAALLGEIVAADPKDYMAWTDLGTVHFKENDFDEAELSYRRAIEANPSFLPALLNLGRARIARKNFDGAIDVLTEAVRLHPRSADVNYFLGEAYLQIKKGSKAVGYLYESIRLDPVGHAEAHLRLAALYNAAGLKNKAAIEYEEFLKKKPDHPDRKKLEQYIKENKK